MPAAYIHEVIASKALKKLSDIPSYIKDNKDAFELGAQGPDILFFYNILKFWDNDFSINRLGEYMHEHRVNDFIRVALVYSDEIGDVARAWVSGLVTHYAVDSTIHPFVYARTDNDDGSRNILQHLLLESQFDTWYYRQQGNKGIPKQAKSIQTISHLQKSDIARLLSQTCNRVYPHENLTYKQAYKTIDDMNSILRLLYSPYKIKHGIYKFIETIINKPLVITSHEVAHKLPKDDFLNMNKDTWINPWDKSVKSDSSFPELFDIATSKAVEYMKIVIKIYSDSAFLDDAMLMLGNNSYTSGLPIIETI